MSSENNAFTGAGDDWHNRALLGYAPDVPWSVYAVGYKEAADRLVVGIDFGQRGQDFLVFPILYLYRHYLELSLKANIRMCQVLLAVQRPKVRSHADRIKAAQGHDLAGLWAYLRGSLPGVYPDPPNVYIVGIDRVIQAFSALDAWGDEARYPVDLQDSVRCRAYEK